MIRNPHLSEGYTINPWTSIVDEDEVMKLWIVNQLMGETEKGDTLTFAHVTGNGMELFTGILSGKDGDSLIPALFSRRHDGVFTAYDYTGLVSETDDTVEADCKIIRTDGDIDMAVCEFFLL